MSYDGDYDWQPKQREMTMGELICLEEYRERRLLEEVDRLKRELQYMMSILPEPEMSGYYLSLEDMEKIERIWDEERRKH